MNKLFKKSRKTISTLALSCVALLGINTSASAAIQGVDDPAVGTSTFDLVASAANIALPDGDTVLLWGYGIEGSPMQYPGPTLIVNEGDAVTITLKNNLPDVTGTTAPMPVSILFPGQDSVGAAGGSAGLLTQESTGAADTVTYTFTADQPGTYTYSSGTRPGLQIEMGMIGTIIVRPATVGQAYNDTDGSSAYDQEYLFVLTEMDPSIHQKVELGFSDQVDNTISKPVLWFINGRNGPDTFFPDNIPWMPHQPYGALARMHPGDRVLFRTIGGGRELHPFHTHGNNYDLIARDGRLLSSTGASADLGYSDYTLPVLPGSTYDAIWQWTGVGLGWDIYGTAADGLAHNCTDVAMPLDGFDDTTREYCADHGKPFPLTLPENQDLTFAGFYSGSPFLGAFADLPPGEGGLNLNGGLFFMWHSHNEKELANNDIFPGGMMTMMIVEPPSVPIP